MATGQPPPHLEYHLNPHLQPAPPGFTPPTAHDPPAPVLVGGGPVPTTHHSPGPGPGPGPSHSHHHQGYGHGHGHGFEEGVGGGRGGPDGKKCTIM
jgi:hypothetical protein